MLMVYVGVRVKRQLSDPGVSSVMEVTADGRSCRVLVLIVLPYGGTEPLLKVRGWDVALVCTEVTWKQLPPPAALSPSGPAADRGILGKLTKAETVGWPGDEIPNPPNPFANMRHDSGLRPRGMK